MDSPKIPDAAIERAIKEAKSCLSISQVRQHEDWPVYLAILNHARLIAKYEPETLVDPLLEMADRMASNHYMWADSDEFDAAISLAHTAILRGIEIAKERGL